MLDSQIRCLNSSQPEAQYGVGSWNQNPDPVLNGSYRQSPALEPRTAVNFFPAREMKFLLDPQRAAELESYLSSSMSLDVYADPGHRNGYELTTLYTDTPELDVYHRRGRHRLIKFRLRRYGNADCVYLERKSKQGRVVRKRRVSIGIEELARLADPQRSRDWAGQWFQTHLLRSGLQPVCVVHYHRAAYVATGDCGAIRVTLDRDITGSVMREWSLQQPTEMQSVLSPQVVCEMKYRGSLPTQFKEVIADLQLIPVGISKFRQVLEATLPRK